MRFESNKIRTICSGVGIFSSFLSMAILIFGPAASLSVFTDLSVEASIPLIGVIATFYTAIGLINDFYFLLCFFLLFFNFFLL
jgi:Na+/proline symporter